MATTTISVHAGWRGFLPPLLRALRSGLVGVPIGLCLAALFYLANYASLGRDIPQARAHVAAAFEAGALQDEDYLAGNTAIGWHQYNDCLILWQALDQRAPADQLAVSPLISPHPETGTRCRALRGFAAGEAPPVPEFYHRYIHGHTMVARYLLPVLTVEQIRFLYQSVVTLLIVSGIGIALIALVRRRHPIESLFFLVLFLAFARWFGVEQFGQSLGHGPSDIVHLSYLLFLAAAAVMGGMSRRAAVLTAGLLGALVITFEFLTGGLPLGIAAVIGALPFAVRRNDAEDPEPYVLAALFAFCAAALTCLLVKMALALYVFGPAPLVDSAMQLQMRAGIGSNQGELAGVDLVTIAKKLVKGLQGMASGMILMAGLMVAAAIAAGVWGARFLLRSAGPIMRRQVIAVLLSNAALALLLGVLWQHTVVHAWFMERTLVWTIGTGFALFALAAWKQLDPFPDR
ncbi:MAG: hypothetical protein AVDCRST_MAG91-1881 [uncultured Sphingomonadaceae bacterium]|uniref:Transmembrane protein n=1 Tax=uncultured Sphingomonadaceae bacterium TaxID=169976 RepID=A0A6J4T7Q9_9SPHN|nr:MAG: hypothetical protein AVDCRST_MAG91-1881 [uncultured Sphingomonadaceae bacterium]